MACGFFLVPGATTCVRCGTFIAKEPRIGATAWIEGGQMIGDPAKFIIQIENSGNIPTNLKIKAQIPNPIEPSKIQDSIKALVPWTPVRKSYELTVDKPGDYTIENIEIVYEKSSKEKDTIKIKPVRFITHGRPIVQLEIEGREEIVLGLESEYYINLKNTGTAPAHSTRIEVSSPSSVIVLSAPLILPLLDPDEESTGTLKLSPLFTGTYSIKIKAVYSSPQMGHMAPLTFESPIKNLDLNVMRKPK